MNPFASVFQLFSGNTVIAFFIAFGVALLIGIAMAFTYKAVKKGEVYTKFMPIAMIVLPLVMTSLIGLINMRNIEIESEGYVRVALVVSAGIALTRFRSDKLSMIDMVYLIVASTLGIVLGIGYVMYPIIIAIVVIAIMLIAHKMKFGENKDGVYTLKYQVGEDLANIEVFEEAISKHCSAHNLQSVRTIEYGQLYEVRYNVTLKKDASIKALIDEVRMHNANLNVSVIIAEKD